MALNTFKCNIWHRCTLKGVKPVLTLCIVPCPVIDSAKHFTSFILYLSAYLIYITFSDIVPLYGFAAGCHISRLHVFSVVSDGTTVSNATCWWHVLSVVYISSVFLLHGLAEGKLTFILTSLHSKLHIRKCIHILLGSFSKVQASVPAASNKLRDWVIDYVIFLHGLVQQWWL